MVAFMTMESPLTGAALGVYSPGELDAAAETPAAAPAADGVEPAPEPIAQPAPEPMVEPIEPPAAYVEART